MRSDKTFDPAPNQGKIQIRLRNQGDVIHASGPNQKNGLGATLSVLLKQELPNSQFTSTKRNGLNIMISLLKFVAPLMPIMIITISMGIIGFLAAIFVTVFGSVGIATILGDSASNHWHSLQPIITLLVIFAVSRGILRYLEQYSGHFIAFKLLALIRDQVYQALRRLAPAKLDTKSSGTLISIITSDVELLEVFYAHTIAPIAIGVLTSLIMTAIIAHFSPIQALIALTGYIVIGFVIPYFTAKASRDFGRKYRENVGDINSAFLESLYGMREIILFGQADNRQKLMDEKSKIANKSVEKIKEHQGLTKALTETAVLFFSMLMLFSGVYLNMAGQLSFTGFLVSLVCLMSSFGPVVTLSNLSNNLLQTFASGERVLDLIEEKPLIPEKSDGLNLGSFDIDIENMSFAYNTENVLENFNLKIPQGSVFGIEGKSGSGKSTLLKLIMRFYDAQQGKVLIGAMPVKDVNTNSLRQHIAYVTQDTYLFNSTIEENLRIAKRDATIEEIMEACRKASIHDFIVSLPGGYQSKVGELGEMLSGGEQQRLGIARAFLHHSEILLLDEPTSNLDSLNESIILWSLKEHRKNNTILLVSHRHSTLSICDHIYKFQT